MQLIITPYTHKSFAELNLSKLQNVLLQESWIKSISIRKNWPDYLTVLIQEKEPVARWGDTQLITGQGKIFTPLNKITSFSDLPLLKGAVHQGDIVMQQYLAVNQLFRRLGLSVDSMVLKSSGSWHFNSGHIEIILGAGDRTKRLQRFIRLYHAELESKWKRIKRIDLRYLNGAAVALYKR